MAQKFSITLTFSNNQTRNRILERYAAAFGYQETVVDPTDLAKTMANPQTRLEFVTAHLEEQVRNVVRTRAGEQAAAAARQQAEADAEAELS
jgi:hypothetical protein